MNKKFKVLFCAVLIFSIACIANTANDIEQEQEQEQEYEEVIKPNSMTGEISGIESSYISLVYKKDREKYEEN